VANRYKVGQLIRSPYLILLTNKKDRAQPGQKFYILENHKKVAEFVVQRSNQETCYGKITRVL
jgi:hypothetical protein